MLTSDIYTSENVTRYLIIQGTASNIIIIKQKGSRKTEIIKKEKEKREKKNTNTNNDKEKEKCSPFIFSWILLLLFLKGYSFSLSLYNNVVL